MGTCGPQLSALDRSGHRRIFPGRMPERMPDRMPTFMVGRMLGPSAVCCAGKSLSKKVFRKEKCKNKRAAIEKPKVAARWKAKAVQNIMSTAFPSGIEHPWTPTNATTCSLSLERAECSRVFTPTPGTLGPVHPRVLRKPAAVHTLCAPREHVFPGLCQCRRLCCSLNA